MELTLALLGTIGGLAFWLYRVHRKKRSLHSRLEEVDQMKKDFISHVSHELKAPLASMQETTHLMLERIPGPLTEKQERLLELNLHSGKRLAQMIGNILDLSRLEAGIVEYDMQEQDIAELLRGVVAETSPQAREKALRVQTDIQIQPLMVQCDPNRLVQLFTNLLENALRFSPRGGTVSVQAAAIQQLPVQMPAPARAKIAARGRSKGFVLVGFADSGPGVEQEHKEKLFHLFHQIHRGRKGVGENFGLGLAIARALVEAHGGGIWADDNPAGGSIFYVVLPRLAENPKALGRAS